MALPFYTAWKTVSSTPSDYWRDSFQALVDEQFENSPTIKTVLHNGTSITVRVVGKFNGETLTRNNDDYQKIIFSDYDYTVSVGDLFVFDSLTYLCTGISSNTVTKSCSVQLTNNTLKFYSPTSLTDSTPILNQIPCIIGKASISQDENKFISLPADENVVTCANTVDSLKINENTRFILSGDAFKVIGIDKISNLGLLSIRLKDDQVTEDDNLTLGIANYYSNQHVYTVVIQNGATSDLEQGNTLQLNVDVLEDGSFLSPTPTITYSSSNVAKATVSSSGLVTGVATGSCTITATSNSASDTISITVVAVPTNNYSYSLSSTSTPDTEIKLNQTKTFTATKYNNGIAIVQGFTFSVSGEATAYTLTTVDGNNCTVKCLKSGYTVVLSATDTSDVTKVTTKTIVLKSLF